MVYTRGANCCSAPICLHKYLAPKGTGGSSDNVIDTN
uniref:Uncharacterized protein n=1 Tax=Anguilla anguilla TaxID=7936 RepID=A0A0E9RNW7_ANGAN